MISHRRIRSGSGATNNIGPSKLSHSTAAPLTPMPENGTGGAELQGAQTGFFSSVFSAAQNAANTLSNSITTLPGQQRGRSATLQNETSTKPMEDVEVDTPDDSRLRSSSDGKEPAVKTLGMGELSLSALGLSDTPSEANTPVNATFDSNMPLKSSATTAEVKDDIVRSATAGPAIVGDKGESIVIADDPSHSRSFSAYESSGLGDQSPRNGSILDGKPGRSNSIRSALGATRRHRGSSAATGTTVGAAIAESGNLGTSVSQPKVTGFAVASKKRNKDFHALFKSVPEDDYLIEDYSCALQREILAHGRLYVSEGHLCFSSNILGWVTTLVMSFDEIVSVEKRNTALLFKNGLMISTLHSRNIFASFTSRDSTYELITGIWKLGHPGLRSSLNGVRIDETGGGDKTEKDDVGEVASVEAESEAEGSDGEFYDEDDEYSHVDSFTDGEGSIASSLIIPKKTASAPATNGALSGSEKKDTSITPAAVDFPGPVTHAPTECNCGGDHYEKVIADEVIAAPMGKIYNLMFGPASVQWLANLLVNDMKGTEFSFEQKIGLSKDNKTRKYEYIKPLFGAIGPKSTKCITSEVLDFFDLEKAVTVVVSTQTPDVPSGNVFVTKTKYCLSWAENGGTRIVMSCVIEWSGKSWLKGPIEKGANDGQSTYAKDIVAALRATISSKRSSGAPGAKKGKKGAKRRTVSRSSPKPVAVTTKTEDWGVLEPLHGILGPVVDIVKPLLSPNIVYGLLVGLLVAFWFGFGRSPPPSDRYGLGWSSSERVAAYEEIWRREENELWDWLEARVGANERRLHGSAGLAQQVGGLEYREASPEVQRGIRESLDEEVGGDLDVREAIRVTEEKLEALKKMVERNASGKNDRKEKGKGGNDTA